MPSRRPGRGTKLDWKLEDVADVALWPAEAVIIPDLRRAANKAGCLLEFYVLAIFKFISEWVVSSDSAYSQ